MESDALHAEIPRVYTVQHDWVRARFAELGFAPEQAEAHALFRMAGYNFLILLGFAQIDEGLIASGVLALQGWLHGLRGQGAQEAC